MSIQASNASYFANRKITMKCPKCEHQTTVGIAKQHDDILCPECGLRMRPEKEKAK